MYQGLFANRLSVVQVQKVCNLSLAALVTMYRPNEQRVAFGLVDFPSNSVFSVALHSSLRGRAMIHRNYQSGWGIQYTRPDPHIPVAEELAP